MVQRLSDEAIGEELTSVPDWTRNGDKIERKFVFPSFRAAIEFINRIAPLADEADHHPEIFNVYDRVELVLRTHDASGLTWKDFDLARKIDQVV
jgi:4a-hydroxytetrahydrobiopterin dehydratase